METETENRFLKPGETATFNRKTLSLIHILAKLVEEGKISMQLVDDAVKRVLRIKFRLGLFDNPYTPTSTEKSASSFHKAWLLQRNWQRRPLFY